MTRSALSACGNERSRRTAGRVHRAAAPTCAGQGGTGAACGPSRQPPRGRRIPQGDREFATSPARATRPGAAARRRGSSRCRGRGRTRCRRGAGRRSWWTTSSMSWANASASPKVLPTPPGNSESPVKRCGWPPSEQSRRRAARSSRGCGRRGRSRRACSRRPGPCRPGRTSRAIGTPVCSVMASASGTPATVAAPVASTTSARARWWSQCWWVVRTWVSPASPISGSRVAEASAASIRTCSPVCLQVSR